ncbi:MAG: hypothetical protein D6730_24730, partial [Bacteroidetes bacterium]
MVAMFPLRYIGLFLLLAALLPGCKEGSPLPNQPPETHIFVESINLSGSNRLNSIVRLHWSGEDVDGFITGYEISLDEQQWSFVTRQDSTFRFDLKAGSDTTDIDFWVRAIDNHQLPDPTPAYLRVPIKNTPPVARFDTVRSIPQRVGPAFSVLWSVEDLDGAETLDAVLVKCNEGEWYEVEPTVNFLTFVPTQPTQPGSQEARVYKGVGAELQAQNIGGLRVGEPNRLFVKARDLTGAESEVDTSAVFVVEVMKGDLLVVDAYGAATPDNVYFPLLQAVYPTYDYLNLRDNFPPFWDPTFGLLLQQYDKVFWYSDGTQHASLGMEQLLETGANAVQTYLNAGGKMFITTKFPATFLNAGSGFRSPIFGFSPMDSLSSSGGQARIVRNARILPVPALAGQLDTLVSAGFITGADPFYPKNPVNDLFHAEITPTGGWTGPTTVSSSTLFRNGQVNQVFFSVELHLLNGR